MRAHSKMSRVCEHALDYCSDMLRAHHGRSSILRSWSTQVKAMKKPPAAVKLVMEAVCIMMGVKPDKIKNPDGGTKKIDDYWGPAQKNLLGDSRFLQNLMDYDKDNMDSAMVEKVRNSTIAVRD